MIGCGLDDGELVQLAWDKREEHAQEGGHSAGRRFLDFLKKEGGAAQLPTVSRGQGTLSSLIRTLC